MSGIIYTSFGFGKPTEDEEYGKFQEEEWAIVQRKKINEYASYHNIPLKVIDYDNKHMVKILQNFEPTRDIYSKTHAIYVLSAIAAIFDFCESEHDTFYWLHLDMVIRRPDINVFDVFKLNDDTIYCWSYCRASYGRHKDWDYNKYEMRKSVCKEFDIPFRKDDEQIHWTCNASNIIMNKDGAIKLRDIILKHMDFMNNPVSFSVIEETIIEVAKMIDSSLSIKEMWQVPTIGLYEGRHFPQTFKFENGDDPPSEHDNSIFIHFWGLNKKNIPAFYEER